MKISIAFIALLFFIASNCFSQTQTNPNIVIKAFVKDFKSVFFTLKDFEKEDILQLSDSSLKIDSYLVYFACETSFKRRIVESHDYRIVNTNSLKDPQIIELIKKYKTYFYILFYNIKYYDKDGKLKEAINPRRIDIL